MRPFTDSSSPSAESIHLCLRILHLPLRVPLPLPLRRVSSWTTDRVVVLGRTLLHADAVHLGAEPHTHAHTPATAHGHPLLVDGLLLLLEEDHLLLL